MRIARDILLTVVGGCLFLSTIFAVLPYFGLPGSTATARGTAVTTACAFSGPISKSSAADRQYNTGFWTICQARIQWHEGGPSERREVLFLPTTGVKAGDTTQVVEFREKASNSDTRSVVYGAAFEPRPLWGGVTAIGVALLAFAAGAPAAVRIVRRVRGHDSTSVSQ